MGRSDHGVMTVFVSNSFHRQKWTKLEAIQIRVIFLLVA
jgi:hypothetical protein